MTRSIDGHRWSRCALLSNGNVDDGIAIALGEGHTRALRTNGDIVYGALESPDRLGDRIRARPS